MDFDLSKDLLAAQKEAKNFAFKEILPLVQEDKFNRDLVSQMGEMGFMGCAFPERYGGTELGFLGHSVICEEISRVDSGLRSLFNLQGMTVPYTIMEWASQEIKDKYVKNLVLARKLGCTCFSEPNAGSDLSAIETEVQDKGDHFLINGAKTWISNGSVADVAIVYASFDRTLKHKGLCAIIVETDQAGWVTRDTPKMGDKASPIAEIFLKDVVAPKENLLGQWGGGFKVAMTALDRGRISVSSGAVGVSQACIDASVEYANTRIQFGVPIAQHQLIKGTLAEMVSQTEAARLLVRRAAWLNDQNRPFSREIAIAKYIGGEAAARVSGLAMEIFGGMGYSLETPVERYYRNAKLYQVGEGTANIMKLIIADDALGIKKANRKRLKIHN
jgi:glutaryl-CoA dehydrogenase (non-decarboxylating)